MDLLAPFMRSVGGCWSARATTSQFLPQPDAAAPSHRRHLKFISPHIEGVVSLATNTGNVKRPRFPIQVIARSISVSGIEARRINLKMKVLPRLIHEQRIVTDVPSSLMPALYASVRNIRLALGALSQFKDRG